MKSAILFQNQPVIQLADGPDQILVTPDHGARILRWTRDGREIITWPSDADWSKFRKVRGGNPILFPFTARHYVEGKVDLWRDQDGTIRSMPIHGFAGNSKFTVIDDGNKETLRMRLVNSPETQALYPFAFQLDVVVKLLPMSRLEIRLETTNTGNKPLPYYAGHHFYLAVPRDKRADWELHLPCAEWGKRTPDGAVIREKVKQDVWHLDDPALSDHFHIAPFGSKIELSNTRTRQRLVFDLDRPGSVPWYVVTTWTETPESDFYCVEPWLGLPNAIHHGEGLRYLKPGQTEIAACVLDGSGW